MFNSGRLPQLPIPMGFTHRGGVCQRPNPYGKPLCDCASCYRSPLAPVVTPMPEVPIRHKISIKDLLADNDRVESAPVLPAPHIILNLQQTNYVPLYTTSSLGSLQGCSTVVHSNSTNSLPTARPLPTRQPPKEASESEGEEGGSSDCDDDEEDPKNVRKGSRPKHVHRLAERRRRRQMSNVFEELSSLIRPAGSGKLKKWEILATSIEVIDELTARRDALRRERDALRQKLDPRFARAS